MNDVLPSLFLLAAGGYFYWTSRQPEHANPGFARATGYAMMAVGLIAVFYSILKG